MTALRREQNLQGIVRSQRNDAFAQGGDAVEYKNLRVEIETKRALLDNLLKQQGETEVISPHARRPGRDGPRRRPCAAPGSAVQAVLQEEPHDLSLPRRGRRRSGSRSSCPTSIGACGRPSRSSSSFSCRRSESSPRSSEAAEYRDSAAGSESAASRIADGAPLPSSSCRTRSRARPSPRRTARSEPRCCCRAPEACARWSSRRASRRRARRRRRSTSRSSSGSSAGGSCSSTPISTSRVSTRCSRFRIGSGLVSILAENMEPSRAIVKTAFPGVFVVPGRARDAEPVGAALVRRDAEVHGARVDELRPRHRRHASRPARLGHSGVRAADGRRRAVRARGRDAARAGDARAGAHPSQRRLDPRRADQRARARTGPLLSSVRVRVRRGQDGDAHRAAVGAPSRRPRHARRSRPRAASTKTAAGKTRGLSDCMASHPHRWRRRSCPAAAPGRDSSSGCFSPDAPWRSSRPAIRSGLAPSRSSSRRTSRPSPGVSETALVIAAPEDAAAFAAESFSAASRRRRRSPGEPQRDRSGDSGAAVRGSLARARRARRRRPADRSTAFSSGGATTRSGSWRRTRGPAGARPWERTSILASKAAPGFQPAIDALAAAYVGGWPRLSAAGAPARPAGGVGSIPEPLVRSPGPAHGGLHAGYRRRPCACSPTRSPPSRPPPRYFEPLARRTRRSRFLAPPRPPAPPAPPAPPDPDHPADPWPFVLY